jgi:hypothetical protein
MENLEEFESLEKILAEFPDDFQQIRDLTYTAMFAKDPTIRTCAEIDLHKKYKGVIKRVFHGDGQIFITMQNKDSEKTFYLGDIPVVYKKAPEKIHAFCLS